MKKFSVDVDAFVNGVIERNPAESEFHQAVREVAESVIPFVGRNPEYQSEHILERLVEPDRIIIFRVCWESDNGDICCNRAWRVQFSNAIGPYKGGLRFHPTVTQSVLKFLGFEQVFKNALTGLPMGGAKGGSNFDPKGRSNREVMRFCQSMMTELSHHIGEDTDIPAGDIGVGAREISYLFGQYKRLENRFVGAMTGKGLAFGGSLIRMEATGYGLIYFVCNMLDHLGRSLAGNRIAISGAGNVAIFAAEKAHEMGATVVSLSDSAGSIVDPAGIDAEKLAWVKSLKFERRGRLEGYADRFPGAEYLEGQAPWSAQCDIALPCATQNELDSEDARRLVDQGVQIVAEGANMPTTAAAAALFREHRVLFAPGKAANAGGVAVSGFEQSQNALRIPWTREEVDHRLQNIMASIHQQCVHYGDVDAGYVDYVKGANVAGFVRVADAMIAYGIA